MALSTKIKTIQNIMRQDSGVDGDAQRISQLGWLIFLKIFDDRERELEIMKGDYESPMPEELRWRNWALDEEGITGDDLLNFVNNDLFPKLKNLEVKSTDDKKALILRSVFEDAFNYMKSGTLLRQVINELNDIDFASSNDRHVFNDVYEKILKDLQSAGNAGEFYTPRAVTQFIVDMVDPKLGEKVFDPACGTGGFLTSVIEHVRKNEVKTGEDNEVLANSIYAVEKKPLPHLLCTTNMILHGIDDPSNIVRGNSLVRPLRDYTEDDRVHVIVTNPPFGGTEEDGIELGFPKKFQTKETADLFLVLIIQLLKDGGKAGLVLPNGSLSGDGVKRRIREELLRKCNVHTIIRLPNSVFKPYASVGTSLVFFTKGTPTKEIHYFEHQLPNGLNGYTKSNPISIDEFEQEKKWWETRVDSVNSWKISIEDIARNDFNLDIANPNNTHQLSKRTPNEIIKKIEEISISTQEEVSNLRSIVDNFDNVSRFSSTSTKVPIEQLCSYLQRGKSPKYIENSSYKVISQKCVQWDNFDLTQARYLDETVLSKYKKERFIQKDDILWNSTGTGTVGRLCIVDDNYENLVADSHVTVMRVNRSKVYPKYLLYYLSSSYIQQRISELTSGSTNQQELNLSTIKKIEVPLLSLDKQAAIIDYIDAQMSQISKIESIQNELSKLLKKINKSALERAYG